MSKAKLCVLCPCYNEAKNLAPLLERIEVIFNQLAPNYNCQVLLVDDGSKDNSREEIKKLSKSYSFLSYIFFTRNFSHQNALIAGLHESNADILITMDADLQQPPEYIPNFLEAHQKGFEIVNGVRKETKKFSLKYFFSKRFYSLVNRLSDIQLEVNSPDFRLYGSKIIAEIKKYNESDLFLRGYVSWLGFSHTSIEYEQDERLYGKSSYSISKMLSFAINGITSMTSKPLRWISYMGVFITAVPTLYMLYSVYQLIFNPNSLVVGWLSLIMLLTFFQGITFLFLGIIAAYLSQIYNESKKRPNYIISEKKL